MSSTRLSIPIEKRSIASTLVFIDAWATQESFPENLVLSVKGSIGKTLEMILEKADQFGGPRSGAGEVQIELTRKGDECVIELLNSGMPLFPADFSDFSSRDRIEATREMRGFTKLDFENCGRRGQKVIIGVRADLGADPSVSPLIERHSTEETVIRELRPGEEQALSRLFFKVYGYRYINDYVYYPEKLAQMIREGRLVSLVAEMPDGGLAGHVGLVRWNNSPPVYEAALGVVDPSYKTNGLFGRIFKRVHEVKNGLPFQYCIYDFVTNHEYSQKLVAKFGYHDMALYLGSQVSETQAKLSSLGIGKDAADMDRYTLLVAVEPGMQHPFGKEIALPTQIGEATEFLLKPLNLNWVPIPRFHPLMKGGEFTLKTQPEQKAAVFDFHRPGSNALEQIITKWKELLRDKYEYVAIDVPVKYPGLGQMYDILASHGFFMSGYVPYNFSSELAFRFQFLTPTKVSFDNIKLFSVAGRKLLSMVRSDYERNTIL